MNTSRKLVLAEKIQTPLIDLNPYLDENQRNDFMLSQVTETEILSILAELKNSAPGYDDIPLLLIKEAVSILSPILCHLCNCSFSSGIFPDLLKIAKVTPVFKQGDECLADNYRPVSVLCVLSRILEKLMSARLSLFCHNNHILTSSQFGFQPNKSTETAVMKLTNDILNEMDNNNFTIGVFLDLSKAFDTVDHNILLRKLENYGIRGTSLNWFKSYLSARKQSVKFGDQQSTLLLLKCGVPQGSILGPLLFLIYINDMINSSKLLKYILFADDSTLYASHSDLNYLVNLVNKEIKKVKNWIQTNKLTLNVKKTHYMIFARCRKPIPPIPDIKIGDEVLKRVEQITFLGVTLDCNLNWKPHVQSIVQKIDKQCGILYHTRHKLNLESLKLIYYTLIHPVFTYCSLAWGGISNDQLKQVNIAHKRIIRTITRLKKYDHTSQTYKDLELLKFFDILKLRYAVFVYRSLKDQNDHNFRSRLTTNYSLRNPSLLVPPLMRSSQSQTSALYQCVGVWNNIPQNIKNKPSIPSFKKTLKVHLMSNY